MKVEPLTRFERDCARWAVGTHGSSGSMRATPVQPQALKISDHLVWDVISPEAPESYHEGPYMDSFATWL